MAGAPYVAVIISNPTLVRVNAYEATSSGVKEYSFISLEQLNLGF